MNRTAKNVVERVAPIPLVDLSVDSPANKRRRGERPVGDGLFTEDKPDPYDEKILVTVKEAAWMLSLPEHAIRQAVSLATSTGYSSVTATGTTGSCTARCWRG